MSVLPVGLCHQCQYTCVACRVNLMCISILCVVYDFCLLFAVYSALWAVYTRMAFNLLYVNVLFAICVMSSCAGLIEQ